MIDRHRIPGYGLFLPLAFLVLTVLPLGAEVPKRFLTLGITIPETICTRLETRLATEITNLRMYAGFKVKSILGYDNKHVNVRNEELDIIDAGYGVYREAFKTGKWSVILHACYHGDNSQMFYSEGVIVTSDTSLQTFEEAAKRPVYAVSPSSATGWQLQQAMFERAGVHPGKITFVKKHTDVPAMVAAHPGSIGFCGAFADYARHGLRVLARTPRVPSALVIARQSVPGSLQTEIAAVLKDFFLEEYRADPVFIRRFYVFPLEQDYSTYFSAFAKPEPVSPVPILFLVLLTVLTGVVVFLTMLLRRTNKKRIIQACGYEEARLTLERSGFGSSWKKNCLHIFDKSVLALGEEAWDTVLVTITRDIERILPSLVHRVNALPVSDTWKQVLSERMDTWALILSFNKRVVEHVRALLAKSRVQTDLALAYTDILTPEEYPLSHFACLDGLLISLYARRNLVVHAHARFISREEARYTLDSWLKLQATLAESGLFSESGESG